MNSPYELSSPESSPELQILPRKQATLRRGNLKHKQKSLSPSSPELIILPKKTSSRTVTRRSPSQHRLPHSSASSSAYTSSAASSSTGSELNVIPHRSLHLDLSDFESKSKSKSKSASRPKSPSPKNNTATALQEKLTECEKKIKEFKDSIQYEKDVNKNYLAQIQALEDIIQSFEKQMAPSTFSANPPPPPVFMKPRVVDKRQLFVKPKSASKSIRSYAAAFDAKRRMKKN